MSFWSIIFFGTRYQIIGASVLAKLESEFQSELKEKIKNMFPGCYCEKWEVKQGIPDLVILFPNGRWATLENKKSKDAKKRPNQDFYVNDMNRKSFSRFIYPENAEEVLRELQQTFGT